MVGAMKRGIVLGAALAVLLRLVGTYVWRRWWARYGQYGTRDIRGKSYW